MGKEAFRYVDIGSIASGELVVSAAKEIPVQDAPSRARQLIQVGDTVFSTVRPYLKKIAWIPEFLDGEIASTGFCVLRPGEALEPRFLFHLVTSNGFVARIVEKQRGASYPAVREVDIFEEEVVVPPLSEQRRIVAKLDEQLAHIEAGEAAVSSAIALRQSLRDALLNLYVLGRNQESSSKSIQAIRAQSSKKIPYGDLLPLPHGWKWRVAQEVCPLITSGSTPEASLMHSGFGEIPFLKVYNIDKRNGVDFSIRPTFVDRVVHEGKLKKSRVAPGDVLTNIVGPPLGKTAVVPKDHIEWNINQAIVAFRAGPELLPEWLRLVLLSPYVIGLLLKTARATAGQFNIALSTCRELPIPVPPLAVQRQLCEFLSVKLAEFDSLDQGVDEVAEQPTELRGALLHAAFTGTLVPQDPADEPASALLDHIRVQRQAAVKPARKRTPRKTTSKPASSGQEELPL
ncbi:restriction endonuclease subunit S [Streptomyces sp. NPDC091287]|uniref:restriction endonuclease subunit S n=1 Tax=Streptomyces sp. NPDC091287 TaxID=3365988 RepID=UPI0037FAEB8E